MRCTTTRASAADGQSGAETERLGNDKRPPAPRSGANGLPGGSTFLARRAGINKALVYRHFRDKNGMFSATLSRELTRRQKILDQLPDTLAEMLVFWARRQKADRAFIQLIAREGLQDSGSAPGVDRGRCSSRVGCRILNDRLSLKPDNSIGRRM